LAIASCRAPIGVEPVGYEKVYRELRANALDQGVPSELTASLLHLLDLTDAFDSDPEGTLRKIHDRAVLEKRRNLYFVLSELGYITAQKSGNREIFLTSAVYAYYFLFGTDDPEPPDPYSFTFRSACDLYNRALSQALLSDDGKSIVLAPGTHELLTGRIALDSTRPGFPWGEDLFSRFLPSDVYTVRGLTLREREAGLGIPVIAVPTRESTKSIGAIHSLSSDMPATVFLRLNGGIRDMGEGSLSGALELYSSFEHSSVQVDGKSVPLEADLTTPLAHSLETSSIWSFDLAGLFSGGTREFEPGIYMVQPYSADKIPVVFVHGTASSPTTWIEMFNWLRADRVLRQRFQFWFFLYPSGSPIAYSGYVLRKSLREALAQVDPEGKDPKLKQMVVIGHSQGGLLTKLTVVDSGDRFWSQISDKPMDEIQMTPAQREVVAGSLEFEHLPFVKRVVYIATPHQGSFLASNWLGRITRIFVSIPESVGSVFEATPEQPGLPKELAKNIPTSLDNMSPGNRFLTVLRSLDAATGVHQHSIVAVDGEGDPEKLDDGLVTYESAHLENVDSELVVRSFHTCLSNPHVIDEVRRILLQHLDTLNAPATTP
jgi:pimeloyl-ACP methyl ester carboxylesterase